MLARFQSVPRREEITFLERQIKGLATVKQLSDQTQEARELLTSSKRLLTSYTKDNEQAKLMIQRFDEILTEKANKAEVTALESRCTSRLIAKTEFMEEAAKMRREMK